MNIRFIREHDGASWEANVNPGDVPRKGDSVVADPSTGYPGEYVVSRVLWGTFSKMERGYLSCTDVRLYLLRAVYS